MKKFLGLFVMLWLVLWFTFAKQSLVSGNSSIYAYDSSTNLTGVYTGGDIIISAVDFKQIVWNNGLMWPTNTVINNLPNMWVEVNLAFKNIGTTPIRVPNSSENWDYWYMQITCQTDREIQPCSAQISMSSLYQWRYILPGQTIQSRVWLWWNQFPTIWSSTNNTLKFTVKWTQPPQIVEWMGYYNDNNITINGIWTVSLLETNNQNNSFILPYTLGLSNSNIWQVGYMCNADTGITCAAGLVCQWAKPEYNLNGVCQLTNNNITNTSKWFDLTIQDITSTYNAKTNKVKYNFKVKNVWDKIYTPNLTIQDNGTTNADRIVFNKLSVDGKYMLQWPYNCNMYSINGCEDYIADLWFSLLSTISPWKYKSFSFEVEPTTAQWKVLENADYSIVNIFSVWSLPLIIANNTNILNNDSNNTNNKVQFITKFTKGTINIPSSTGSTASHSTRDKEDLAITNITTKWLL